MAITRVEIKDFLVFKGEFSVDFCPGVNVIIGANGTGKTTLLREMYYIASRTPHYLSDSLPKNTEEKYTLEQIGSMTGEKLSRYSWSKASGNLPDNVLVQFDDNEIVSTVYIPEKDILEHARGLLPFIEQKPTGFSPIYKDVIVSAQDLPLNNQSVMQKKIGEKLADIIGGVIEWVQGEGTFYTIRKDGLRIPFSNEASGFKKLGYLGFSIFSDLITVRTNEIAYLKNTRRKITLFALDSADNSIKSKGTFYSTVDSALQQLPKTEFVQCERSHVINLGIVRQMDKDAFILIDDKSTKIPIGKVFKQDAKKAYFRYLEGSC